MKSVFIAGSRKFFEEIDQLVRLLKQNGIVVATAEKQKDDQENERAALFRAFQRIDRADIVYVLAKGGYIGNTVAMEIAYAHAKNKEIISSEPIAEQSAIALISSIMKLEKFVEHCSFS